MTVDQALEVVADFTDDAIVLVDDQGDARVWPLRTIVAGPTGTVAWPNFEEVRP